MNEPCHWWHPGIVVWFVLCASLFSVFFTSVPKNTTVLVRVHFTAHQISSDVLVQAVSTGLMSEQGSFPERDAKTIQSCKVSSAVTISDPSNLLKQLTANSSE